MSTKHNSSLERVEFERSVGGLVCDYRDEKIATAWKHSL